MGLALALVPGSGHHSEVGSSEHAEGARHAAERAHGLADARRTHAQHARHARHARHAANAAQRASKHAEHAAHASKCGACRARREWLFARSSVGY